MVSLPLALRLSCSRVWRRIPSQLAARVDELAKGLDEEKALLCLAPGGEVWHLYNNIWPFLPPLHHTPILNGLTSPQGVQSSGSLWVLCTQ